MQKWRQKQVETYVEEYGNRMFTKENHLGKTEIAMVGIQKFLLI